MDDDFYDFVDQIEYLTAQRDDAERIAALFQDRLKEIGLLVESISQYPVLLRHDPLVRILSKISLLTQEAEVIQ